MIGLLEVAVQQALQGLAVTGLVPGHLVDGVADTPEKMERYIRTIYTKANEMDTLINELTLYCVLPCSFSI